MVKTFPKIPIITYGIWESGEKAAKILGASHYLKKTSIGQPADAFYDNLVRTLLVTQSKQSPGPARTTSIGRDGAAGLLKMRQKGSPTIGQDAATSTVYGMPKSAFEIGAVQQQLPLLSIPQAIYRIVR